MIYFTFKKGAKQLCYVLLFFSLAITGKRKERKRDGKAATFTNVSMPIPVQKDNVISDCEVTGTTHNSNFDISSQITSDTFNIYICTYCREWEANFHV